MEESKEAQDDNGWDSGGCGHCRGGWCHLIREVRLAVEVWVTSVYYNVLALDCHTFWWKASTLNEDPLLVGVALVETSRYGVMMLEDFLSTTPNLVPVNVIDLLLTSFC